MAHSGSLTTASVTAPFPTTRLLCPRPLVSSRRNPLPGEISRKSPSLASKRICPSSTKIHIRIGEGCGSPIQPAGKWRNPHCAAGSKGETLNGSAGGANCCEVTLTVTDSNRVPPVSSATSLGKVSSLVMESFCGITFDMRNGWKQATPCGRRPLLVRRHSAVPMKRLLRD
jgi:hypothetical protein